MDLPFSWLMLETPHQPDALNMGQGAHVLNWSSGSFATTCNDGQRSVLKINACPAEQCVCSEHAP